MELTKLAKIINREFGEPFLPKGAVEAKVRKDGTLVIKIGARDVNIDDSGNVLGAGTRV